MAREATIRKHARKELEAEGYILWCPPNAKYQQTDIFGIFDGVAVKKGREGHTASDILRYIQWTSRSNIAARRKKIQKFFDENHLHIPCEIWGWDSDKRFFKKEYL